MLARRLLLLASLALLSFGCEALLGLEDAYVVGNGGTLDDGDVTPDGSVGEGDGSHDEASVLHAPLAFDPPLVEMALDASAPFTVRLTEPVGKDVHLTFSVARERLGAPGGAAPPDGGAPTVDPPTVTLTATNSQASLVVHTAGDVVTAPFAVTASAATADGVDLGTAALSVHVLGHPGDLDTSFGTDRGYFDFDPSGNCQAQDVIVLPDHRFYVVGYANNTQALFVARFFPDGSLDPTYATGGKAVLIPPSSMFFNRMKAALLPDGSLVVATGGDQTAVIVHVLADGTFDNGFGGPDAGALRTGIDESIPRNYGNVPFVVRPTGELLVGGAMSFGDDRAIVRQFHPDGGVDTAFGGNGTSFATFSDYSWVRALALQANGNVLVGGDAIQYVDGGNNQYDEYFTVLGPTGSGVTQAVSRRYPQPPTTAFSGVTAIAPADGGALLGVYNVPFSANRDWGMLRVTGNVVTAYPDLNSGNADGTVGTILVLADGSFLVNDGNYSATQFWIAKFHADGTPDTTFGTNGVAASLRQGAWAMALDDRLVYAVGSADATSARIARYWVR